MLISNRVASQGGSEGGDVTSFILFLPLLIGTCRIFFPMGRLSLCFLWEVLFGMGFGLEHFYSISVSDVDDPHSSLPCFPS